MRRADCWPLPDCRPSPVPDSSIARILATPETIGNTAAAFTGCGFFVDGSRPRILPLAKEEIPNPRATASGFSVSDRPEIIELASLVIGALRLYLPLRGLMYRLTLTTVTSQTKEGGGESTPASHGYYYS